MISQRCALAIALVAGVAAMPGRSASAQTTLGWNFTMKMDTDSGEGSAYHHSTATKYQSVPHRFRMEFIQLTGASGAAEGTYQVFNDADSSFTIVMPTSRTATVTSLPASVAMAGGQVPHATTHITRNDVTDLGAGEPILGYATRRFHVSLGGVMEWKVMDQSCSKPLAEEMDAWIASDVDLGAIIGTLTSMGGIGRLNDPSLDRTSGPKLPKGGALRTIMKHAITDRTGATRILTTTLEVVELTQRPIPDAAFAVPADYKTIDMRQIMADLPAGMMDSVMRANAGRLLTTLCGSARQ